MISYFIVSGRMEHEAGEGGHVEMLFGKESTIQDKVLPIRPEEEAKVKCFGRGQRQSPMQIGAMKSESRGQDIFLLT